MQGKIDNPTKNVLIFVKASYLITEDIYNSWKARLQALSSLNESMRKKYYPAAGRGSSTGNNYLKRRKRGNPFTFIT
jgi:hypothetical protein